MKNSKEIYRDLQKQITLSEDPAEIRSIIHLVMENVLGLTPTDIASEKPVLVSELQQRKLTEFIVRINLHEPIQYIINEAYFFGRRFNVSSSVLIPRPETELLIEEVLRDVNPFSPGVVLDIGTGSGCIAITLAKELPAKRVLAMDVSENALRIAAENAKQLNASVEFFQSNALTEDLPALHIDILVSNPPYVTVFEKNSMKKNVLDFEPHLALFVPEDDPLIFYKMIAEKGYTALSQSGRVFVEINERYRNEVSDLFADTGFKNIKIVKDLQGKNRIISASKQE